MPERNGQSVNIPGLAGALSRVAKSRAFWALLLLNAVLLVLYMWSRGGSTIEVRIQVVGNRYEAYVDGQSEFIRNFAGPSQGGIGFALHQSGRPPTLPGPHGVDWVRVTDVETGEVLFEDDFSDERPDAWVDEADTWTVSSGVFEPSSTAPVLTAARDWTDYVLEARLRNIFGATVFIRAEDPDNAILLHLSPGAGLRGQSYHHVQNGVVVDELARDKFDLSRTESARSIVAMLVKPYPAVLALLAALTALIAIVRLPTLERLWQSAGRTLHRTANWLAAGLAVSAAALFSFVIYVYGQAVPHVPDSVAYVFQAKIFASFSLTASAPPVEESFFFFNFLPVVDGRWFSQYPFGHPAFLAVGKLFGAMWLVPPLLGAASVGLIYLTGKRLYGALVAITAATLLFFSPFFQMNAANFMSHNSAGFVLLACLFFLTRPLKHRMLSMLLSGIFLGLLFNIRPLTAVAFIPVLGLSLGYELLRAGETRRKALQEGLAFAAGGALMLGAYLMYNLATTGDLTSAPYSVSGTQSSETVGFGGSHSLARGLFNQETLLGLFLLVVNGWPATVGLGLAALPFVTGKHNRWDVLFAGSAIVIAGSYVFYVNAAALYGPRFWYEVTPFIMLLTARGVVSLHQIVTVGGDWFAARMRSDTLPTAPGVAGIAILALVAGLVAFSSSGWMFGVGDRWENVPAVPASLSAMKGYNFSDDRFAARADELGLENALVFAEPCEHWWCYGVGFWRNAPGLDGDEVWAQSTLDEADLALLEAFPGRDLYLADYADGSIRPTTAAEIRERVARAEAEAQEEDLAELIATRGEAIADHPATPAERDAQRRDDLERVRAALESCAEQSGAYPDSGGSLQVLWTEATRDDVCLIEAFVPDLPRDPLGDPERDGYWYLSDGSTFTLVALQETANASSSDCPADVRPQVDPVERYCVVGGTADGPVQ